MAPIKVKKERSPSVKLARAPGLPFRDDNDFLSGIRNLRLSDTILLLTPQVSPVEETGPTGDPFEHFGRSIAARHRNVHHMPYFDRYGVTESHRSPIRDAGAIIVVVNSIGIPSPGPQITAAHITSALPGDDVPVIIVLTNNSLGLWQLCDDFSTVIQTKNYTKSSLSGTAAAIFGE